MEAQAEAEAAKAENRPPQGPPPPPPPEAVTTGVMVRRLLFVVHKLHCYNNQDPTVVPRPDDDVGGGRGEGGQKRPFVSLRKQMKNYSICLANFRTSLGINSTILKTSKTPFGRGTTGSEQMC